MDQSKLATIVFHFLDEFFLEASGKNWMSSKNCQKERWSICESCEYFDEPEEGCKKCGCYLPHKIADPLVSVRLINGYQIVSNGMMRTIFI